ncbi:MAG: MFS transporter, partial [Ignavibacteria bacterium]|nr:MFS transporter [Ignavibacteria bacterium]
YIIEGLVYFGILTILGKYSSENLSVNDAQAGLIYSFVTGGITFSMLMFGGVSDKIGVRRSLALAFILFIVGRFFVALSGSLHMGSGLWSPMFFMMTSGLLIMVLAYGLYQPAAYAGVKRYTTPKTAAMAYAAIYGFMNLGAFLSGFISSFTRKRFEDVFPPNGLTAVFWVYVGLTGIALLVSLVILSKKNDQAAVVSVKAEAGDTSKDEEEEKEIKPKINNIPLIAYALVMLGFFLLSGLAFDNPLNVHFS